MKGNFGGVPYEIEGPTRGDTPCTHAQGFPFKTTTAGGGAQFFRV